MRGLFQVLHRAGFIHLEEKKAFVDLIRLGNAYVDEKFLTSAEFEQMDEIKEPQGNQEIESTDEEVAYAKAKLQHALMIIWEKAEKIPIKELAKVVYQCWGAPETQYDENKFSYADYIELMAVNKALMMERFDIDPDASAETNELPAVRPENDAPSSWMEAFKYTAIACGVGYGLFKTAEYLQTETDQEIDLNFLSLNPQALKSLMGV